MGIKDDVIKVASTCVFPRYGYEAMLKELVQYCKSGDLSESECELFTSMLREAAIECNVTGEPDQVLNFEDDLRAGNVRDIRSTILSYKNNADEDHNIGGLRRCLIQDEENVEKYANMAKEMLYGQQFEFLPEFITASISADMYTHFMRAIRVSQYTSYINLLFDGVAIGTSDAVKSFLAAVLMSGRTGVKGYTVKVVSKLVKISPSTYKFTRFIRLVPILIIIYSLTQFFDVVRAIMLSYEMPNANLIFQQADFRLRVLRDCGYLTAEEYKLCNEQVTRIAFDVINRYSLPTSGSMVYEVSKAALPTLLADSIDEALDSHFSGKLPSNFFSYVLCCVIGFTSGFLTANIISGE